MATLECIASASARWVAVHRDDRIALHSGIDGALVREVERPGGPATLVFTPSLLIEVRTEITTVLTAFSLPDLRTDATHQVTLPFPARVMANAGVYVLIDAGVETYLVRAEQSVLGYMPLLQGGHARWAVGLDDEQFLAYGARGPEIWNAPMRRPTGLIKLPIPAQPRAVGFSQQSVWFLDDTARIQVFRLSDGKPITHKLPAPGTRAVGHPDSGWVLVDVGDNWVAINLVTGVCEPVPATVLAPCAVLPLRSAALLMQPTDTELAVWELGGAPPGAPGLRLQVDPVDPRGKG